MNRLLKSPRIHLSPLRLHSVSTVHLKPNNYNIFSRRLSVNLQRTHLHSASSVHIPNSTSIFNNKPFIKLSPIKSHTLKKYNIQLPSGSNNVNSGRNSFASVFKCNRKRCCTCKTLTCKFVIKSTSNGRNFNTKITTDIS